MSYYRVNEIDIWEPTKHYPIQFGGPVIDEFKRMERRSDYIEGTAPVYEYAGFEWEQKTGVRRGLGTVATHHVPGSNRSAYYAFTHMEYPRFLDRNPLIDTAAFDSVKLWTPTLGPAHVLLRRVGLCQYSDFDPATHEQPAQGDASEAVI